jgi:hypothetical protein
MAKKVFDTGQFAEKVLALSTYDMTVLQNLYNSPVNKQKINRGAAFLIKNYFNEYMDARARQNPSAYHHVYEFDKTGNSSARLFQPTVISSADGSAVLNYSFVNAKEPNREGYPFPNKADIMESGQTVVVTPKRARYLRYELDDGRFVTSEKSVIRNPGGTEVQGSFGSTFTRFMASQGGNVLQKFGFFQKIEQSLIVSRKVSIPRINYAMKADAVNRAKIDAMNIADTVVSTYA